MFKEKIYLYLDDVRTPVDSTWQIVRSHDQFINHIQYNGLENYQCISFDHDLGEEKTGMDCARWVINYALRTQMHLPVTYVHSANPVGTDNIINYINNYYKNIGLSEKCVSVQVEHTLDYLSELSAEERLKRLELIKNELN